ncbi:MAG: DUF6766 family protein [Chloroflexota bacterium]
MKRLWRDYSLSITLFALFAVTFVAHTISGWFQYAAEQQQHGQQAELLGDDGYIWSWAEWTFQNWQSEFLELGSFVVLSSFLIHKGSPESKDGDDEMMEMLQRIQKRLDELEAADEPAPKRKAS